MYYIVRSADISFEYLNKLSSNAHEVHKLLAKFFNADVPNWRQLNNVLYHSKRLPNAIKLVIKSDVDIDEEAVVLNGFEVVCKYSIEERLSGSTVMLETTVYPCTRNENGKKRLIRGTQERIAWLTNKLTHNDECRIVSIDECEEVCINVEHTDKSKGCTQIWGYTYEAVVDVQDKEGLLKVINRGIGAEKCYGFGLVEVH